jgi:hypothetical protein
MVIATAMVAGFAVLPLAPAGAAGSDYDTTVSYVEQFYPLWFYYHQLALTQSNHVIGPDKISPLYHTVVAINNDTLYASTLVDVSSEPVIVTVPQTEAGYSVLNLDSYGDIYPTALPSKPSGTLLPETVYALTSPSYVGVIPPGMTQISMPLDFTVLVFRVDRYSPSGVNQEAAASQFRAGLLMQTLTDYQSDPTGGAAGILPEAAFAAPYKTVADGLIKFDPVAFLQQLQTAVHSSQTPPMTPDEQALSDEFDTAFAAASDKTPFKDGARAAHAEILSSYLDHLGPNNWIHFTNIGEWGDQVVQRSAIAEFIQVGNGPSTAAYYQTFKDGTGHALMGDNPDGYVLTFPPGGQPDAKRFWSVTAYTPDDIELIANPIDKYEVASYTPGLVTNPDGSLTIYISPTQPAGVPTANWLPVSTDPFNLMLRVYGVNPGSSVANNTYVPPPVEVAQPAPPINPVPVTPTFTG